MGKNRGPGRPPEIGQGGPIVPKYQPPPPPIRVETPEQVIPSLADRNKVVVIDPIVQELEILPDGELYHLAGNHCVSVAMTPKGAMVNRAGVIEALTQRIREQKS